jgi:hypothetical protein
VQGHSPDSFFPLGEFRVWKANKFLGWNILFIQPEEIISGVVQLVAELLTVARRFVSISNCFRHRAQL